MQNNLFYDYCSTIDTKKYNLIEKTFRILPITTLVGDAVISSIEPSAHSYMLPLFYSSLIPATSIVFSRGKDYTIDVNEVRELYDEFINNYNNLNKMFNLNDPLEINVMFSYLYKNGYLSKNKEFTFQNINHNGIYKLMGASVVNGNGVCRHISAMLRDILNGYSIDSTELCVFLRNYYIDFKDLKRQKYTKEELIAWAHKNIIDEDRLRTTLYSISKLEDDQSVEIAIVNGYNPNIFCKIMGNHAITYANYENKSYFLDPTQEKFYRLNPNDGCLYDRFSKAEIKVGKLDYDIERYKHLRKIIDSNLDEITKDEEISLISNTNKLIEGNKDIFENFYDENKELYSEISSKMLLLK